MPLPLLEDEDILILVSMVEHIRDFSKKDRSDMLKALSKKMQECVSIATLLENYVDTPAFSHRIPEPNIFQPAVLQGQVIIVATKIQYQAQDEWNQLAAIAFILNGESQVKAGMVFAPAYDANRRSGPCEMNLDNAYSLIADLGSEDQVSRVAAMEQICSRKYESVEVCGCWIGYGRSRAIICSDDSTFCSLISNSSILDDLFLSGSFTSSSSANSDEANAGDEFVQDSGDEGDFIMIGSTPSSASAVPSVRPVQSGPCDSDSEERQLLLLADEEDEARVTRRQEPVLPVEKGLLPVVISKVKALIPGSYHGARLGFVFGCLAAYVDDEKLPSEKVEEVLLQTVSGAVGGSVGRYAGAFFAAPAAAGEAEARRALLKAGTLASAAVVAVSALYDGLQYARGRETRIDVRRNLAANTFGAAGSLLAGAAVAAAAAGSPACLPAGAVALGASVAGIAGGICGSYAGRVADAAAFDAEADAAVHAYEFFGWPAPPRHGPRPVRSAAEIAAAYRRRLAERPGAARWAGRCTENLLKLLRTMHLEYAVFQRDLRNIATALRDAGPPPTRFVRATAAYLAATAQASPSLLLPPSPPRRASVPPAAPLLLPAPSPVADVRG